MRKFFIAVGISLMLLVAKPVSNKGCPLPTKTEISQEQTKRPTLEEVKVKIEKLGLEYPKIVFYQVREESGNLTSDLYLKHNNLLGMKYPAKRKTLAIGKTRSGYAIYKSWKDSLKDYKLFQEEYYKGLSRSQYIRKLRTSYTKDENYLKNYL